MMLHERAQNLDMLTLSPHYASLHRSLVLIGDTHLHLCSDPYAPAPSNNISLIEQDYLTEQPPPMHLPPHDTPVNCILKMDITGFQVNRCGCYGLRADGGEVEMVVGVGVGGMRAWWRQGHQRGDEEGAKFGVLELGGDNTVDYTVLAEEGAIVRVLALPNQHSLTVEKLTFSLAPPHLQPHFKIINTLPLPQCPQHIRLIDHDRLLLCDNQILGIYQNISFQLPSAAGKAIAGISVSPVSIMYSTNNRLCIYDRSKGVDAYIGATMGKQAAICAIKSSHKLSLFTVVCSKPTSILLFTAQGELLSQLPLPYISQPLPVDNSEQSALLMLIDTNQALVYTFDIEALLQRQAIVGDLQQETKVHDSTLRTMKQRQRVLQSLGAYVQRGDMDSVSRFLAGCGDNAIRNDGVRLVAGRLGMKAKGGADLRGVLCVANLCRDMMDESKYQSHIETSLETLLAISKRLPAMRDRNDGKTWSACVQVLRELQHNKKFIKLKQQDKNKHIFELCYELGHVLASGSYSL